MRPEETIDLLDLAASIDGRDVGRSDIAAWHLVIGDLEFVDAQRALVDYYRESRFRIMPADIRQRVKAFRRTRLEHTPLPAPSHEIADSPGRYKAELDRLIDEIASGKDINELLGPAPRRLQAIEEGAP